MLSATDMPNQCERAIFLVCNPGRVPESCCVVGGDSAPRKAGESAVVYMLQTNAPIVALLALGASNWTGWAMRPVGQSSL